MPMCIGACVCLYVRVLSLSGISLNKNNFNCLTGVILLYKSSNLALTKLHSPMLL